MNDDSSGFFAFLLISLIIFVAVFGVHIAGQRSGADQVRKAAIEAGVAEYRADPQTGAVEFKFKVEKK